MRVLIPLLCLCTTTVLAGKMVAFDAASPAASAAASLLAPTSAATPFATEAAKHWTELVRKQSLGLEAFAAKQMPASDPAKPAVFNLAAEVAHWKKSGNPDVLAFLNDEGKIIYGLISGDAPIAIPEVKSDSIKFHFFNKFDEKDTQGMLVEDINTLKKADWEAAQPVKVIVHGFGQSIRSPAIQTIKNAFLKTGKFNVIAVDWSKLAAAPDYRWARSNVATAGNLLGHFLKQLTEKGMVDPKQVHIIGHGLGAHVAGIAGKFMHAEPVARITGLDPAAPLFELTATDGLIQKTDAALVDIIHSNAGLLGRSDALGHADFFPNGGVMQAGCGRDFFGTCSHNRAVELFARSVLNGKGFPAVLCPHLPAIDARSCLSRDAASAEATAFMGAIASFPKPGFYFVETAEF